MTDFGVLYVLGALVGFGLGRVWFAVRARRRARGLEALYKRLADLERRRPHRRRRNGLCLSCGSDQKGLDGRCAECYAPWLKET